MRHGKECVRNREGAKVRGSKIWRGNRHLRGRKKMVRGGRLAKLDSGGEKMKLDSEERQESFTTAFPNLPSH